MNDLLTCMKKAPRQKNDDEIRKALVQAVGQQTELDRVISQLNERYSLEQIYKVYYQNFS